MWAMVLPVEIVTGRDLPGEADLAGDQAAGYPAS